MGTERNGTVCERWWTDTHLHHHHHAPLSALYVPVPLCCYARARYYTAVLRLGICNLPAHHFVCNRKDSNQQCYYACVHRVTTLAVGTTLSAPSMAGVGRLVGGAPAGRGIISVYSRSYGVGGSISPATRANFCTRRSRSTLTLTYQATNHRAPRHHGNRRGQNGRS